MKILLVAPLPPPIGGIQTWTQNILSYVKTSKQNIYFINSGLKHRKLFDLNLYQRIFAGSLLTIEISKKIKKIIKSERPDIMHYTSSGSIALLKAIYILRILSKYKVPMIIHWRFGRIPDLSKSKNWEWKIFKTVCKRATLSIVLDNQSVKCMNDAGIFNVINIPNPISCDLEQISNGINIAKRSIEPGKIIFVGHVYRNKGVYELVEACVNIPAVKNLTLIGPVNSNTRLELENIAKAKEEGLWINFTGMQDKLDIYEEIKKAECLVLPSYTEGFPNVILEAMALACPVIATEVGAIPDMINYKCPNPAGICITKGNIEELKNSINFLLNNKSNAKQFGINGRAKVLENYTMSKVFPKYEAIWHENINS